MPKYKRIRADLRPFVRITSLNQLEEGMILIDKWACKRKVLLIGEHDIWLSHKFGIESKVPGKSWPKSTFLERCPNWIWMPREERIKKQMSKWIIWSFEHNAWWKENRQGYTHNLSEAGKYAFEDAATICAQANAHGTINEAMMPEVQNEKSKIAHS